MNLVSLGQNRFRVELEMVNFLEQVLIAQNVEWKFDIEFDFSVSPPTYEITRGLHKLFPLYEVYIGDQRIYGFDGVEAGFGAIQLAPLGLTDVFHSIFNRQAGAPGVLVDPDADGSFRGELSTDAFRLNECLTRAPSNRLGTCN